MTYSDEIDVLVSRNEILAGLPDAEYELIRPLIARMSLNSGDIIYKRGEPATSVIFPVGGILSMLSPTDNSPGIEIAIIGHEGIIGFSAVLLPDSEVPWTAMVQVDGEALTIPTEALRTIVDRTPVLRARFFRCLELVLFHISQTAGCNARHSLPERLARWLLVTIDRLDSETVPLTHEFLAAMLGVRRAGVTVTANELQAAGLIKAARGRMTVVNREGLEKVSCSCYGIVRQKEEQVRERNARASMNLSKPGTD